MNKLLTLSFSALSVVVFSSNADAAFAIRVTDGVATVQIDDNGIGDLDPAVGTIVANNISVGTFSVDVETSSRVFDGTAFSATLSNSITRVTTTAAGAITFLASASNFFGPGDLFVGSSSTEGTGPGSPVPTDPAIPGAEYSFESFFNDNNAFFGMVDSLGGAYTTTTNGLTFGDARNDVIDGEPVFSLTNVARFEFAAPSQGSTRFSGTTTVLGRNEGIPVIPEPASMVMFGLGGLGLLGGAVRRRRAEKAAA